MTTIHKMRKISIMNYKGGTGKTTTVVNLAHSLAIKGKKVLVVDTDPQGSSGYYFGLTPKYTLFDLIVNNYSAETCITKARENIDIICSNEYLFPAEISLNRKRGREKIFRKHLASLNNYDYVLLDCAPSINLFNQNALTYADEVFLPVSMEYLSLVGVKQLLKNLQIINKIFSHNVSVSKVIPTFFDKHNSKSNEILDSLQRVFPSQVSTPIRMSVALSEAPGYRQTIFEYDQDSTGAEDFIKLAEEVLN